MRRLSLILAAIVVCSCSTLARKDLWLGGPSPDDQYRSARADTLEALMAVNRDQYLGCVSTYAAQHAKGTAAASEIADAAAASCHDSFDFMLSNARDVGELRANTGSMTPRARQDIRDRYEQSAAQLSAEVRERGRQAAIKAVVDARP